MRDSLQRTLSRSVVRALAAMLLVAGAARADDPDPNTHYVAATPVGGAVVATGDDAASVAATAIAADRATVSGAGNSFTPAPAWAGLASSMQDSPFDGRPVVDVEVSGNQTVTRAYVLSLMRTEPGSTYSTEVLQGDIRRLQQTGKFVDVYAEPRAADGGVIVNVTLSERPTIAEVQFEGNVKHDRKALLEEAGIKAGDPLDRFLIEMGKANIETLYRTGGYSGAEVTIDEELLERERVVLYRITEGPRVRIRRIQYEGNQTFSDSVLQDKVSSRTYVWLFRAGAHDPEQVAQDEVSLQQFLRGQGFLDCRVSHRLDFDPRGEDLTLTFVIEEGPRYAVRTVSFTGEQLFSADDLRAAMQVQAGGWLLQDKLRQDVQKLNSLYYEQGHIYVAITVSWVFAEEPGLVDLNVAVEEGEPYTVGRIVIRGNRTTRDKVVRRELSLYPGEVFDLNKARESERQIRETTVFSGAKITPVGEQPGFRDALVEVTEAEQLTKVLFGVGVSSNSGVVGNIMIENRNFDLFDWPRTWEEMLRGRAFRGAGQTLRLQIEPGTELNRFRIDFFEPYLLDRDLSLGTSLYYFERGREGYDEERLGGTISFGRRFKKQWKNWSGEVSLRLEDVQVSNVDWYAAKDIREVRGDNYLSSVKGTIVNDTTDSRFVPSLGHRWRTSYEQAGVFGGDFYFGKLTSNYSKYYTMKVDEFDRKHVLALGAGGGVIFGDAPVFERFYAGGIGSLRGFEFRGVSPRQGVSDDAVGGDFLLTTGAEYSFPIYGDNLRGVLFTDMGTVEENFEITDWRVSIGAGIRMTIDFFGPIPLEFDFAIPMAKDGDDDTQVFSFYIGTTF